MTLIFQARVTKWLCQRLNKEWKRVFCLGRWGQRGRGVGFLFNLT